MNVKEENEKVVSVSEEYLKLTKYSTSFRNRILQDYNVIVSYHSDNQILLKSEDMNNINRVRNELFESEGNMKVCRIPIEKDYLDILLENKDESDISDNRFITEVSATVHYIFNDSEQSVYIVSDVKDLKFAKLEFTLHLNQLLLKSKDSVIQQTKNELYLTKDELQLKEMKIKSLELKEQPIEIKGIEFIPYDSVDKKCIVESKESPLTTINKYLEIGRKLSNKKENKWIKRLIASVQKRDVPFQQKSCDNYLPVKVDLGRYMQFIFICASSGTGKTQLPFSLEIPLLYFHFNENIMTYEENKGSLRMQSIYKNYLNLSKALMQSINNDLNILDININESTVNNNTAINLNVPLYFPCLIYELCKRIVDKNEEKPWIISELEISVKIEKMSITNLIIEMEKLFGKGVRPVIFFDECQKDGIEKQFIWKYLYVRRCTKLMNILSIFMGTNASMANFIDHSKACFSRGDKRVELVDVPWCFVVHRLAPTCNILIENKLVKTRYEEYNELIEMITESVTNERPLFVQLIFEQLRKDIDSEKDVLEIIENIAEYIYSEFTSRKKPRNRYDEQDIMYYNFSNLSLMSPEFWSTKISSERKEEIEATQSIHTHIAYLHVPDVVNEIMVDETMVDEKSKVMNFFGITVLGTIFAITGASYIGENKNQVDCIFTREQTFRSFKEEPYGQLAFIGHRNYENIFLGRKAQNNNRATISRISTWAALNLFLVRPGIKCAEKKVEWANFELGVSMCILVSSQRNGFLGMAFKEWIKYFICELSDEYELYDIKFPENDQYWNKHKETIVPICSSSISAPWNDKLAEFLVKNKAQIGTVYNNLDKSKRDFYVQRYNGEEVMSGECKNHSGGVSNKVLQETIDRFDSFETEINLIVVNSLANINSINLRNVYLVKKFTNEYRIEKIFCKNNNPGINKGFLIIDRSAISK